MFLNRNYANSLSWSFHIRFIFLTHKPFHFWRTIRRITRELSRLRSRFPLNIHSSHPKCYSRPKYIIPTSTKRVKCVCQSSAQKTGSLQRKPTKVWTFTKPAWKWKSTRNILCERKPKTLVYMTQQVKQSGFYKICLDCWIIVAVD